MKKKLLLIFVLICIFSGLNLYAQTYSTGLVIDTELYESIPRKAVQLTRSLSSVPASHSLKQFAPIPNNQGRYGTCTAWASAYAARTMLESIELNRIDRFLTTQNVFSPLFLYKNVRSLIYRDYNPTGREGIAISHALDFLRDEGAIKMPNNELSLLMSQFIVSSFSNQRRYPIEYYERLYASYRQMTEDGDPVRTQMVKKSISEGKPVVIGIKCPPSFYSLYNAEVWYPSENHASIDIYKDAHAICVVGYDDNKYGGAFEIQNSWGTDWGNGGFIWIPYTVFNYFAYEAYEVTENISNFDTVKFSGFIQTEIFNSSRDMPVRFDTSGFYKAIDALPSGTRFRFIMESKDPAYVYAFASDSTSSKTNLIFPVTELNESPILDYAHNMIAWPGEYEWMEMDDVIGTDFLVVLFSKQALDIDNIRQRFENARGTFPARVATAVGSNFIPARRAQYTANEMRFTAQSTNQKAVFGLLLAIDHVAR